MFRTNTVADPLFADFSGHRTLFCPVVSIYDFSTHTTPHITAQSFQHIIRGWVAQIRADNRRFLIIAGNLCWRLDRIGRGFARTVTIFVKVSTELNIVDSNSLSAPLQLDLSAKNCVESWFDFSRTAHYIAELKLMFPSIALFFSDAAHSWLRLSSERTLRLRQDYQSATRFHMSTETQSEQSSW